MSLEIKPQVNIKQPIESKQVSMKGDMPSMVYSQPDLFSAENTQTATSTGLILVLGMAVREGLKKLSDGFFAKYFSRSQNIDEEEMKNIAKNMLEDKNLIDNVEVLKRVKINGEVVDDLAEAWQPKQGSSSKLGSVIINKQGQDAFFAPDKNFIKVTKDTIISLPHEIGHAVEEHSTNFLKKLQRSRGKYAALALILYGLGREKPANSQNQSFIGKVQNVLYKYNLLVPFIAFLPELVTEFAASKIGIDYIKEHIEKLKTNVTKNAQSITKSENILKVAKKHYAIAFCTYLSLPLFAVLDNYIFKKATKN